MMRLLFVEDDRGIAAALIQALANDHQITLAPTGGRGLFEARNNQYDAVILDLNLPDMSGLDVCRQMREDGMTLPILILSAETEIMSKIRLLDAGADDYLTKPFSLGELKARLRVLHRNTANAKPLPKVIEHGDLMLDADRHYVERQGQRITLRPKEFLLLECLMLQPGLVISRSALGNYAWHGDTPWTNTIDVHIKHLRDKIDRPFERPLIQTVHGIGYKLTALAVIKPPLEEAKV